MPRLPRRQRPPWPPRCAHMPITEAKAIPMERRSRWQKRNTTWELAVRESPENQRPVKPKHKISFKALYLLSYNDQLQGIKQPRSPRRREKSVGLSKVKSLGLYFADGSIIRVAEPDCSISVGPHSHNHRAEACRNRLTDGCICVDVDLPESATSPICDPQDSIE